MFGTESKIKQYTQFNIINNVMSNYITSQLIVVEVRRETLLLAFKISLIRYNHNNNKNLLL